MKVRLVRLLGLGSRFKGGAWLGALGDIAFVVTIRVRSEGILMAVIARAATGFAIAIGVGLCRIGIVRLSSPFPQAIV